MFKNIFSLSNQQKISLAQDWSDPRPGDRYDSNSPEYAGPQGDHSFDAKGELTAYLNVDELLRNSFFREEAEQALDNIDGTPIYYFINGIVETDPEGGKLTPSNPIWPFLSKQVQQKYQGKPEKILYKKIKHLKPIINNIEKYIDLTQYPFKDPGHDPPEENYP